MTDPELVTQLFACQNTDEALGELSPRDRDVLAFMAEGPGNAAIAKQLFVSEGAVSAVSSTNSSSHRG